MRSLMAALVLMPLLAHAQDVPVQATNETPYWSNCRHIWTRSPYVAARFDVPYIGSGSVPLPSSSPSTGGGSSGSSLAGGGGSGAGYAVLALVVVAIAALPFIVYAVDSEADAFTREQFYCPELSFSAMGGVQLGVTGSSVPVSGLGVAKLRLDLAYVGAQAEVAMNPSYGRAAGFGSFAAHFLLRPVPKAHIEGALAIGGRRAIGPGGTLDGLELALPHTYVLSRDGYRKLGLELNPRVFWNRTGLDVGVDLGLAIPVADVLQVRVGTGAFSHAGAVQFTASAGLSASF